jgi:hypothetical protein
MDTNNIYYNYWYNKIKSIELWKKILKILKMEYIFFVMYQLRKR